MNDLLILEMPMKHKDASEVMKMCLLLLVAMRTATSEVHSVLGTVDAASPIP